MDSPTQPRAKQKQVSHSIAHKMKINQEVDRKEQFKTEICKKYGITSSTLSFGDHRKLLQTRCCNRQKAGFNDGIF